MRFIVSFVLLLSFNVHSKEISKKAFLRATKLNKKTLERLEVGMSSNEIMTVTNTANLCDNSGSYCYAYHCEYETTKLKTIIAVKKKKHYIHVEEVTKNITGAPECELSDNKKFFLELKFNRFNHNNELNLETITKIEKVNKKQFKLHSNFSYGQYKSNSITTYDLSLPFFYAPLEMKFSSTNSNFIMKKVVSDYKDPKEFNLENIKLCDFTVDRSGKTCSKEQNYFFILK